MYKANITLDQVRDEIINILGAMRPRVLDVYKSRDDGRVYSIDDIIDNIVCEWDEMIEMMVALPDDIRANQGDMDTVRLERLIQVIMDMYTPVRYHIVDWANNEMFDGILFNDFDDAWDYIQEQIEDEDAHQDIYVKLTTDRLS